MKYYTPVTNSEDILFTSLTRGVSCKGSCVDTDTGILLVEQYTTVDKYLLEGRMF